MAIEIIQIGITEPKERTWGRVYIDYVEDGSKKFAFKNYIQFNEKNFEGIGSFEDDATFKWFDKVEVDDDYDRVLDGEYDFKTLTPDNYKKDFGTPSIILKSLIICINGKLMQDINERRGEL